MNEHKMNVSNFLRIKLEHIDNKNCRPHDTKFTNLSNKTLTAGFASNGDADRGEDKTEDAKHVWRSHRPLWSKGETPAQLL